MNKDMSAVDAADEQVTGVSGCPECARLQMELDNFDAGSLKPVTAKELVERCGGDFIDEICLAGPIRHPEVFAHYTPERMRQHAINVFEIIGSCL